MTPKIVPFKNKTFERNMEWCFSLRIFFWFGFMVFKATFNNISVISWRAVFLVEETGVPGENHRPVTSHYKL